MSETVLVIGGGAREHALVWKLSQSPRKPKIICAPGNPGIAPIAECANIGAEDLPSLLAFAKSMRPDLTIVGPDNPLAKGIVDMFQHVGLKIFGPNQKAAQFEASKCFAKDFCLRHDIPTARCATFTNADEALGFSASLPYPQVIKADGLALGKGVIIAQNAAEVRTAVDDMMIKRIFGGAGEKILIEEFMEGLEVSAHAFLDGKNYRMMPLAQDHKRIGENNTGPNTGGMGTYSPVPFADASAEKLIAERIFDRFMAGCVAEEIDFKGVLFPGIMLTDRGPYVIEFNARFGDPETQSLMRRLDSDLLEIILACTQGSLSSQSIQWKDECAATIVLASEGYPGVYKKGLPITGIAEAEKNAAVKVFHAGTKLKEGVLVNSGGRVLSVSATGPSLPQALQTAYAAAEKISFEGKCLRRDIGFQSLSR
ncbi:MAG: phosphoribosylamine--glycine ligase [Verrucomicrobiae bacterium]|nr:phosphoribosylamine--glycine ligase [Verrucomicrobiae bacterium]